MDSDRTRDRLTRLREELALRLTRTHKHIYEREERVSADFSEQSAELESQELVMSLDAEGRHELRQIDAALARLAAGTYRDCARCGKDISEARLTAIPFTSLCIDCATKQGA